MTDTEQTESEDIESEGIGPRTAARRAAVQALYQWLVSDTEPGELIRQFKMEGRLTGCDRDYFVALVQGVINDPNSLEDAFVGYLDRTPGQLDPVERAVLLLGTLELRDRVEIPRRVVINEALELTKRFGAEGGHRFINGVLDRVAGDLRALETGSSA